MASRVVFQRLGMPVFVTGTHHRAFLLGVMDLLALRREVRRRGL